MVTRRTIDRESADKSVEFMERSVRDKKPFFVYYPMTQIHFPTLAHPDFAGKTGAGDIADAMAEMDANVGRMLDADRSARHLADNDRVLVHRQRRRGPAAVARIVGPVVGFLQQRDGGRDSHAVPGPLAGKDSGGPRQQRTGAPDRSLPDDRGRGRRRYRPAATARSTASTSCPSSRASRRRRAASRCCSTPTRSCAR